MTLLLMALTAVALATLIFVLFHDESPKWPRTQLISRSTRTPRRSFVFACASIGQRSKVHALSDRCCDEVPGGHHSVGNCFTGRFVTFRWNEGGRKQGTAGRGLRRRDAVIS